MPCRHPVRAFGFGAGKLRIALARIVGLRIAGLRGCATEHKQQAEVDGAMKGHAKSLLSAVTLMDVVDAAIQNAKRGTEAAPCRRNVGFKQAFAVRCATGHAQRFLHRSLAADHEQRPPGG